MSVTRRLAKSVDGARRAVGLTVRYVGFLGAILVVSGLASVWGAGLRLELRPPAVGGWPRVSSAGAGNQVHTIEASADLKAWVPVATAHDGPFEFADPAASASPGRFYRAISRSKTSTDDGKNVIRFPDDAFLSGFQALEHPRWIKFAILLADTNRVWFQDSAKHLFHYEFATQRLAPFKGLTRPAFDALTLHRSNQVAVLGAVLYGPESARAELGIQFVGLDPYPPGDVARWFHLVRSAVNGSDAATLYYLPTVEQLGAAEMHREELARQGVTVSRAERWVRDDACYSPGWALGRLVVVPVGQIAAAYADGRLRPTDILVTDAVPAEVPYVAGIIALTPATPNAHAAILARSYGVPFVYLADAGEREQVQAWAGREVVLRLDQVWRYCTAKVVPLPGDFDPDLRAEILALKAPGTLRLTPKERFGALSADTTGLMPADVRFFGGKAANFGLLRRRIPNDSPPTIAFSFDLWDEFLDQALPGTGRTLRQEIRERTAGLAYPPDLIRARAVLSDVRDLIRNTARFSAAQEAAVLEALAVFDPSRNIRFRSSTNVEDSEQFTGAGLYDSYSGCVADDVDGDAAGPSRCDPTEAGERGVFRALRRVYASLYNENAWLERLRFGVNEDEVGMAVLAHHSFPDGEELANGVATIGYSGSGAFRQYSGELVTQLGAVSVANPEGGVLPEVVSLYGSGDSTFLTVEQRSNLVPLGGNVMAWSADYDALSRLLRNVVDGYHAMFPTRAGFTLDFEYKKIQPGELIVKQVREIPQPETGGRVVPFVVDEPTEYVLLQGEFGDVWANHRLKCRLTAHTRSLRLRKGDLTGGIHTAAAFEYLEGTEVATAANGPSGWPGASFGFEGTTALERWAFGAGSAQRSFTLATETILEVDSAASPLLTQQDFRTTLSVKYATPVVVFDGNGQPQNVSEETAVLTPRQAVTAQSLRQQRRGTTPGGVALETTFWWPEPPRGPSAGYTAPVIAWEETRIAGLTSAPLVLRGYYSQTYRPGHHNFWEEFIFDPRLEPGLEAEVLAELAARDVLLLFAVGEPFDALKLYALGANGRLRMLK